MNDELNSYFEKNKLITINKFHALSKITLSKINTRIKTFNIDKKDNMLLKQDCEIIYNDCFEYNNYLSIQEISKKLNIDYNSVVSYFEYLNVKFKKLNFGKRIVHKYTNDDFLKLKFFVENNNVKDILTKNTKLKKYGSESYNNSEQIKKSLKETYSKNKSNILEKRTNTMNSKYGCFFNNRELAKKTCIERYNVDSVSKIKDVIDIKREKYFNKSEEEKDEINNRKVKTLYKHIEDYKNKNNLISIIEISEKYDKDKTGVFVICDKLNVEVINYNGISFINKNDLYILDNFYKNTHLHGKSISENEIKEYLKSLNVDFIENDRTIISPKELDVYIPSKKVAIEFDGLYWHSTLNKYECNDLKNKHLNKTISCEEKGIRLIHIFEDEWLYKKDICKSIISSALGIYKEKYFARKCVFKKVENKLYDKFINENHIQGCCNTHYKYGLFYNDELIQVMGFSKNVHKHNEIELNRMCTKLNTQIIGGFSKLLKNAMIDMNVSTIYSYVSRRMFDGKGYYDIGFKKEVVNKPTYFYVKNGNRFPRYDFMKNKIKKLYNAHKLFYWNENETEEEIMFKNNYGKIYDCGTIKVKYSMKQG